ncbi:putative membrane protein YccC [Kitasatospora gansuensis]|uniref:Putative membrane protein YccC n=1 Tax=Kitasatospora gansuensis TaxID=258050 RepID=A0A7W7SJN4_9ACTN|nr:FUSC family protein [Kitasatospora gansuensis]MBB4951352.1 putative membrane protein YccC [Kitasatospora gansuensis]
MPQPPAWLAHPFRWQRGPVPWPALLRGALGMGPVLAAGLATGHRPAAIAAGLGAMFATLNDRPGTRRVAAVRIAVPALAGALGFFGRLAPGWWALPLLTLVGLLSGAVSVAGPVCAAAAVQLLVLTAVGAGMPLAAPPWVTALCFLAGALWPLLLRLTVSPSRADGERHAVAAVFDALADALDAVGTPAAEAARRRLTGALDQADEALRLWGPWHRITGRPLLGRFAAAAALCEASVALLWEGTPLPPRVAEGPRLLAAAVRAGAAPGALPAPVSDTAARSAFDRAVLDATLAFADPVVPSVVPPRSRPGARPLGPVGRENGLRVAVCVAVSTAAALLLRADYWYWLPVTAAFLVKPDVGPLFSRVVNRCAGTALGVLLFAALPTRGAELAAVTLAGALIPLAGRHFAAQTAVITVTVLAFVSLGGDTRASGTRLADTALACAIVLVVGHLPRLASTRTSVGHRFAVALRHARHYLEHVLSGAPEGPERAALRRTAYRALAEARAAAETAAAELHADRNWLPVTARAERIVDATTACAVRLDHGRPTPAAPTAHRITTELAALADTLDGLTPDTPEAATAPADCRTLNDIVGELHRIRTLTDAR